MEHEEKNESTSHEAAESTHAHHEAKEHHTTSHKKMKSSKFSVLFFGILGALVVAFLIFYGVILSQVKKISEHSVVLKTAKVFNMAAVKTDGETLSYVDYINDVNSLKKLRNNPTLGFGNATDQDISDLVVANFLTTQKIREVAKTLNVEVTPDELSAKKAELFSEYGEEAVKKNILESYGWDMDTFVEKILAPTVLASQTREAYEMGTAAEGEVLKEEVEVSHILFLVEDPDNAKAKAEVKKKAQSVLNRLKKGEDFSKLATEFSEDPGSKEEGGNLGWNPRGKNVPEFEKVAFSLEPGKLSELVETEYGFHIIKVTNKRTLRDFDAFIDGEVKKMQPQFYIPIHNPLENFIAPTPTSTP